LLHWNVMKKIGFLLHVYHLETTSWEEMVWGRPERDELGTATKLVECMLNVPAHEEIVSIVYSGPSQKDGLTEGAYTKQFLVDRIGRLGEFPRLKARLGTLPAEEHDLLARRINDMVVGPVIKNTLAEVHEAAGFFAEQQADMVIQVAAATHAARCLRDQVVARYEGLIALGTPWLVAASDVNYHGVTPHDVVIAEPIHRQDNPLFGYHPSWVEVTKRYPHLTLEHKKELLARLDEMTSHMLAAQPHDTPMAN
jgi:hypothetical protein